MIHKKEEGTYHRIEKLTKEMPGFLSPGRCLSLLLIPEYSGINKEQRIPVEKAMAPHSSTLAWKIPWAEEPGGLQSVGLQRVRHDWVTSLSLSKNNWIVKI